MLSGLIKMFDKGEGYYTVGFRRKDNFFKKDVTYFGLENCWNFEVNMGKCESFLNQGIEKDFV